MDVGEGIHVELKICFSYSSYVHQHGYFHLQDKQPELELWIYLLIQCCWNTTLLMTPSQYSKYAFQQGETGYWLWSDELFGSFGCLSCKWHDKMNRLSQEEHLLALVHQPTHCCLGDCQLQWELTSQCEVLQTSQHLKAFPLGRCSEKWLFSFWKS